MNTGQTSPVELTLSLIAAVVFVWILVGDQTGTSAAQTIFTGPAPSVLNSDDVDMLRLRFEAGARSHWHSHSQGQLLLVEEGRGRTQVRGEPVREMLPGIPVYAGPRVAHWHGAAPDQSMIQLTIHSGEVEWMEAVSDEEYLATPAP